jgi:hypothetical protein
LAWGWGWGVVIESVSQPAQSFIHYQHVARVICHCVDCRTHIPQLPLSPSTFAMGKMGHEQLTLDVRLLVSIPGGTRSISWSSSVLPCPPPRQFQNAVPELFTGLYVFRVLGGIPVHLKWRGDLSRLKKTCFGHNSQVVRLKFSDL